MVSEYELHEYVTHKGYIELYIKRPVRDPVIWKTVKPPSWLEKLRGITFEQKVFRARESMQHKRDKLNKRIEDAEKLAHDKKLDLSTPPQGGSVLPSKREV